jgi:hypothetical protein
MPWFRKVRANHSVAKSFAAGDAPRLDPRQPKWLFKVNAPGKFGQALEFLEELIAMPSSFKGRHVVPIYLKAADDMDAWVEMARVRAMGTHGLKFLNDEIRSALIWHITVERLEKGGAPTPVVNHAKSRLERYQEGPLYSSLFNPHVCAKVSLTPLPTDTTYFHAYFQPLLIAFDEEYFAESGGLGATDELHAVMRHLNHLASKRIAAIRFDGKLPEPDGSMVRKLLHRELPGGPANKHQRAQAKKFNNNHAAQAMLVVCTPNALNQAEAFERSYKPDQRMARANVAASCWTPATTGNWDCGCFLWQCDV